MPTRNETNSLRKGYLFPGDVIVQDVLLVTQYGEVIDIKPITIELNIYENLSEHYLQCDAVISDAVGLIDSLEGNEREGLLGGFNGGEVLVVRYTLPTDDAIESVHIFAVYELADRNRIAEKQEVYTISAISFEAYQSSTRKISRAYGPNLISEMVRGLVDENLYNRNVKDLYRNYREVTQARLEKTNTYDATNGLQKLIIPNMSVDDAIDFLASEADNDKHVPMYVFYENARGFNFRDIGNLVLQDPVRTFTYLPSNVGAEDADVDEKFKDYSKIISYSVLQQTNLLKNAKEGLFRSRVINLDILKKNKREVVFEYDKEVSKFNKLQPFRIAGSSEGNPQIWMMNSRTGHDQDPLFTSENPLPKRINQFVARRRSYRKHIYNNAMEVTVPGDNSMCIGDTVYLSIPVATDLQERDGKEDKYLSGKYLITRMRHKFTLGKKQEFYSIIQCVKDTGIEI